MKKRFVRLNVYPETRKTAKQMAAEQEKAMAEFLDDLLRDERKKKKQVGARGFF